MMNHKLMMALALAGVFTVPMSTAYAEGDEQKKPEQSQLIAAEDDKKETPKPETPKLQFVAEDDKKDPLKPELIAEGEDKGDSKAELVG